METIELVKNTEEENKKNYSSNQSGLVEGKKESIDSVRVSADTVLKDSRIRETIGRFFGGFFGIMVLFGSITNVIQDFKTKKMSPWVYSRIVVDFVASGALIGYALNRTLIGIVAGLIIGILTLIMEMLYLKK